MLHPLPWYIAGPLVGLIVPALLLAGNKAFGISSNFRHICAAVAPCGLELFRHDWKRTGLWNLTFLAGVCTGAALAAHFLPPTVQISARTIDALRGIGVRDFAGLAPHDVFAWASLLTLRGFICVVVGGVPVMIVALASALAGTWVYGFLRPHLPH